MKEPSFKLLLPFLICCSMFCTRVSAECKTVTLSEFEQLLPRDANVQLIFFSTWCRDCKTELQHAQLDTKEKYLAINVFDAPGRATKVLANLQINVPCIHDKNGAIAKKYAITSVPKKIIFNPE